LNIIIKNRTDLDPASRKLFSAEYDGQNYWVRSIGSDKNNWRIVKDDVENCEYNSYTVRNRGHKFTCSCVASMNGKKVCRHIDIIREIMKHG